MNNDRIIILSSRNAGEKHVSYNTILGLENEFMSCIGKEENLVTFEYTKVMVKLNKIMNKCGIKLGFSDRKVVKNIKEKTDHMVFFSLMGMYEAINHMPTLKKIHNQLILYIFDCWESDYEKWTDILEEIKPCYIFFAYKKATMHFSKKFNNCYYMPQSMDINFFFDHKREKGRLFMQMGRRTELLHSIVLDYLNRKELPDIPENYIYEKEKGKIIFKSTEELASEINKTYFFLAAPNNIENSQMTGAISEVTARFYEAMACKSLIIGIKPSDSFDELFPYEDAMIEVTEDGFVEKIDELLNDKEKYKEIVDYNYNYVMEHHRWKNRFEQMIEVLNME